MKKLNHNRVLNIVAALLFVVSLMCGSVLQVRANDLEQVELNITCRDSTVYPKLVASTDYGDGTFYEYYTFESSVTYTLYELYPGYTYNGYFEFKPYINMYFDEGVDGEFFTINTNLNSVQFSEPSGINYMCDFDSSYGIYNPSNGYGNTLIPLVCVRFEDLYSDVVSTNLRVTLNFTHNVKVILNDDFSNSDFSLYLKCDELFPTVTHCNVFRELGDHRSAQLDAIIDQNNTSNGLLSDIKNDIQSFKNSVGEWFGNLTGNLTGWFEALFQRMDEEQDELLNGYQDTTTSEAANAFSSESDKLTALEGDLSNQSNQYVSDFTAEGFDLGILATIGSSMVFVTTWFTNFWNMGGIWTAGLNFCFALTIVFFIFRFKR